MASVGEWEVLGTAVGNHICQVSRISPGDSCIIGARI